MLWQRQVHPLFTVLLVFAVRARQYRHQRPLDAKRRLDNVRNKFCVRPLDSVFHALATDPLDVHQVKISAVGDAHQLLTANRIIVFDVNRLFAIMRPILRRHV